MPFILIKKLKFSLQRGHQITRSPARPKFSTLTQQVIISPLQIELTESSLKLSEALWSSLKLSEHSTLILMAFLCFRRNPPASAPPTIPPAIWGFSALLEKGLYCFRGVTLFDGACRSSEIFLESWSFAFVFSTLSAAAIWNSLKLFRLSALASEFITLNTFP